MTAELHIQFQTLLDQWAAAIVANDAGAIDRFVEPDWVLVTPEGGAIERERFLSVVRSSDLTHSEMTLELLDAREYGDLVVVLAHGTNHGDWQGEPFSADEWVTEVFVRRRHGWRCAISALTPNDAARPSTEPVDVDPNS